MKKLIFSVGVCDVRASEMINGKQARFKSYSAWAHMLERCYSEKYHIKFPTYIGCYVCSEWLVYSNFKKWFDENYIDGYQLDKDLLIENNKSYSPSHCIFVPSAINSLFLNS